MAFGRPRDRDLYRRRLLLAVLGAVVGLVLAALLGPSPEQIDRWFQHTGQEGPPTLLDRITIIPDDDARQQQEMETMAGATQGLDVQVEPTPERRGEERPTPREQGRDFALSQSHDLQHEGRQLDWEKRDQVQMNRAGQRSLDFVLLKAVMPNYPTEAPPAFTKRTVVVVVGMYVNEEGRVQHAYIVRSDGGPLFDAAVLSAVRQWEYKPLLVDGTPQPFWDEIHFTFPPLPPSGAGAPGRASG